MNIFHRLTTLFFSSTIIISITLSGCGQKQETVSVPEQTTVSQDSATDTKTDSSAPASDNGEQDIYTDAFALIDAGKIDEAKALVSTLEASKEKADWIMKLENYKKALVHMENGELEDASRLIGTTNWEGQPAEYKALCDEYAALRYWTGISGINHMDGERELSSEETGKYTIRFKLHGDKPEALFAQVELESFIDVSNGAKISLIFEEDAPVIYRELEGYHSYMNLKTGHYELMDESETEVLIEAEYMQS